MLIEYESKFSMNEEDYIWKELESYYSGHLHRRSAMETSDDCGNCDGARCDTCKMVYQVTVYKEPDERGYCYPSEWRRFDNLEDARAYYWSLA